MRQECAMTTVDNLAVLEQVEGGIVCLDNNIIVYPGCSPCTPLPHWPGLGLRYPICL
jgi:hypothetical protein